MPKLLLALLIALIATGGAPAAPDGFRESVRLTPRIQAISGNQVAVVYCARTYAAWEAKVKSTFGPEAQVHRIRALTTPTENAAYFMPSACLALEKWIRGKRVSFWDVGMSALFLAHEANHLRGIIGEREAECSALRDLPTILRQHFAVQKATTLKAMMTAARTDNRRPPNAC